ncbi:MAG: protein kinase [Erythrobacter sp.]|uniref:ORC-CDC6 family AAA ATPase n=1 Tax=Erythrobacter sp. TaxID=1042 RepID=UPI003296BB82
MDIGPLLVGKKVESYNLEEHRNRGHYGTVLKARNRIGKHFAIKLVPSKLYEKANKSFNEEISKYTDLGEHPNIGSIVDAGEVRLDVQGNELEFFFIVMEWIEGESLTTFMRAPNRTVSEVISVINDIVAGLIRFENSNLWHNDLNSDNIIVAPVAPSEISPRKFDSDYVCKIVDVGSAIFRGEKQKGRLTDLEFLAFHINEMQKVFLAPVAPPTRNEQFLLDGLQRMIAKLQDESESRRVSTALQLSEDLDSLYQAQLNTELEKPVTLADPFGYTNANDFPNDQYVNSLFCESMPWIDEIANRDVNATLITGPRGSGKTMILKSMRLRTRMLPTDPSESAGDISDRLDADGFVGFFVSARREIGNHCSLPRLPSWAESDELTVYYFNLLFAVEAIETIDRGSNQGIWEVAPFAEAEFCKVVGRNLGLGVTSSLASLVTRVRRQQGLLAKGDLGAPPAEAVLSGHFLTELVEGLRKLSPFMSKKEVVFLLDDFSKPKVPAQIQKALLPIIWNTGGGYSFRVSAHSESVETEDLRGNQYKLNREFKEVNLGQAYLEAIAQKNAESSLFPLVEEIFSRRFEFTENFKGKTLFGLLGDDDGGAIGAQLREAARQKAAHRFRYFGRNTVLKLCSGDISYLIDMIGQMTMLTDGRRVKKNLQHSVIRRYAWTELYRLRDVRSELDTDLNLVALSFGMFSRHKLIGRSSGNPSVRKGGEYLKIEVQLDGDVDETTSRIADLLQNGVFVDGGFSNAGSGVPTRRLMFRRIFTPAFPTTYNSSNTLPMTASSFKDFLSNPEMWLKDRLKSDGIEGNDQADMFDKLARPISNDEAQEH